MEPDIEHHGKADDLWTGFEVFEGRAFGHNQTLVGPLPCLNQSSSEKAPQKELSLIIQSAALSAIIIVGAFVLPETSDGITEQSAIRKP